MVAPPEGAAGVFEQQARMFRTMFEAGRRFASSLEPQQIYDALRVMVCEHLPCDGLIVSTYDERTHVSRCAYIWVHRPLDPSALPPLTIDPFGPGMQAEVIRTRRGRVFADVVERTRGPGKFYDVDAGGKPRDLKASGAPPPVAKCAMMVPILRENHLEGIVQIMSDTKDCYDEFQLAMLEGLVSTVGVALRNAELYEATRRELAERRRVEESLRESEARLFLAQSAAGIGVWDWNAVTGTVYWSETMWALYGLEPDGGGPTEYLWQSLIHAEDAPRMRESVERYLKSSERDYRAEFRVVRGDGEVRWLETLARAERDHDGTPLRMTGVNVDVTARKEAEETLRAAASEKDEFLAMLGHELRNPLAPIRNAIEVLNTVGTDTAEAERMRAMIGRQVTHMARMLDDLLDVARIARDKIRLRRGRRDLAAVVANVVDDHRATFAEAGIQLRDELRPGPVWVDGDATRLAQVMGNLLDNARKFTDPGGTVEVRLEVDGDGDQATVTVRDTGIGLTVESLTHIFDAFSQAEQELERSRAGLGLGLAVARGLVLLHGGSLGAASDGPGHGSTFTMRLPIVAAPEGARSGADEARGDAGQLRILVIEDNHDSAESQRLLLRLRGHEVEVAHSGDDGITRAREFRPDVILCDIGLPDMNGYTVAERLRDIDETRTALLIAQSGYGQERDRERARAAGFDLHLRKPVDPATLDQVLARSLEASDSP